MNWIIFTTECSGKTTFCRQNKYKINQFNLIDWDTIKSVPDIKYENELLFIDLLFEIKDVDNKIYLTNIIPPDFIFSCKDFFKNINFVIVQIDKEELIKNIKNRHHPEYDWNYIISKYEEFCFKIDVKNEKIKKFKSFEDFKNYIIPQPVKLEIKKRIIRL